MCPEPSIHGCGSLPLTDTHLSAEALFCLEEPPHGMNRTTRSFSRHGEGLPCFGCALFGPLCARFSPQSPENVSFPKIKGSDFLVYLKGVSYLFPALFHAFHLLTWQLSLVWTPLPHCKKKYYFSQFNSKTLRLNLKHFQLLSKDF